MWQRRCARKPASCGHLLIGALGAHTGDGFGTDRQHKLIGQSDVMNTLAVEFERTFVLIKEAVIRI
jgi:hypothetical protein